MSKILNRPMFRGGGKVSSYGNGIATGLADGGRVNLGFGGALKGGLGTSNYSTATKGLSKSGFRFPRLSSSLRALGQVAPQALRGIGFNAATGAATLPAAGIYGLMKMNSADTDEGLKVMRNEPSGTFDETGAFEMEDYSERFNKANQQGNKISFMDNFLLDPETGTYPKFMGRSGDREKRQAIAAAEAEENIIVGEEEKGDGKTDTERRLEMEKNALKELLESFGSGSKKEDTEDEALAAIEKKQKLLEKVMGGGKSAMIDDVSTMGLNYASGALKEGATVKSSFADFFEKEAKRPSRSQKVKDAAANAAIQAYLTEKISEKDFSKQMALITGQAQIKQKFAKAAVADLTVQDYVRLKGSNTSKSEAIEDGARGIVQNNPKKYKGFTKIESKDNIPGLLIEANLGEVFLDKKTREVFAVIILEDGTVGKEILYN